RAGPCVSPRPLARAVGRAAACVRARPGAVPERVSAELGDRRARDVLRVEVHERGTGAGELPYAAARSGSCGGFLEVAVERDAIHPVGGWSGPVRVWQPLPSLSRRRRGRLGGAPVRGGHVRPAHSVPRRAPGGARSARTHTRPRMAAGDRARPGRGERGAARSARARLVAPGAGGGRLAAIVLGAASGRPTVPAPALPRGAVWEDVAPSPDGRWVAGSRSADGHWALVRWPVDSPDAASVLVETGGSIADVVWTSGGELWFVADPTGVPQAYRWRDSGGAGG